MWSPFASKIWEILVVKIAKCPTNGGFQRVDTWMWSYVRLFLNDTKQSIVTNIQFRGVSGPNILRDFQRKILLQEILNFHCSMRERRILNEHHFEGVEVPTYPRHQNIFQNFQLFHCVDFKACFDEMRRLWSDSNGLFSPARNVLVLFRSLRGLCWLLWTLLSGSKAAITR